MKVNHSQSVPCTIAGMILHHRDALFSSCGLYYLVWNKQLPMHRLTVEIKVKVVDTL